MSTDEKTVRWYNENAEEYTKHVRTPGDSVYHSLYEKPAMYSLVPDVRGKKAISIGCGSGEDSNYLQQQGANESFGIDISQGLIEIASKSYPDCSFRVMDMEKLDFPDESFDFAYSSLAIHYLPDWTQVFKEVFRVLKPNCFFLFSCSHPLMSAMEVVEESDVVRVRQISVTSHRKDKTTKIIGDYLHRHTSPDMAGGHMDVTTWHKPFGEIFDEANAAGFVLDMFLEPKPLPAMKDLSSHNYERLSKIPFFVVFRFIKK